MKFCYLVTVTVPDGGGDDGVADLALIGQCLDEAATDMDRPIGSEIETRILPQMACSLCGGDGWSISDPCFGCMRKLEASARSKSAPGWLNGFYLFRPVHPLQIVVFVLVGAFLGMTVCKLLIHFGS